MVGRAAVSPFLWKGARGVFGYVTPDNGEMKVREYECYRAVYCGPVHAAESGLRLREPDAPQL